MHRLCRTISQMVGEQRGEQLPLELSKAIQLNSAQYLSSVSMMSALRLHGRRQEEERLKHSAKPGDRNCNRQMCHTQPAKHSKLTLHHQEVGRTEFPWAKLAMKQSCKDFSVESCLVPNHCLLGLKPGDYRDQIQILSKTTWIKWVLK